MTETTQTATVPLIYPSMAQCIVDIGLLGIGKENENKFQKFNYRSVDQVLSAFNTVFAKNGIFMVQRTINTDIKVIGQDKKDTNIWSISFDLEVTFYAKDGSTLPYPSLISGCNDGKDCSKITGQLTSYLLKELLFKQFLVPTVGADDLDGRDSSGTPTKVVEMPNDKGIAWTEPDWAGGQEAVILWAAKKLLLPINTVQTIFDETPADPSTGLKGKNFYAIVKKKWQQS